METPDYKASEVARMRADAVLALIGLGFKKRAATRAVSEAIEEDHPPDLDGLLRAALRRCGT